MNIQNSNEERTRSQFMVDEEEEDEEENKNVCCWKIIIIK